MLMLTFDRMQNSVVQGLAARVIGGRADACSTTVGQSVPDTFQQERVAQSRGKNKQKQTCYIALMQADKKIC